MGDSVSIGAAFSIGDGSRSATGSAVFFAAIVFAGFLAALRAAGFLPAAFFFAAADGFVTLTCFAAARARFAGARFEAAARLFADGRLPLAARFLAAKLLLAAARFLADMRLLAERRFLAAALRIGRLLLLLLLAARLFAAARLLAAVRVEVRLAAAFAGFRAAVLRTDRFTDFLAADFLLAAMLASDHEDAGCSR